MTGAPPTRVLLLETIDDDAHAQLTAGAHVSLADSTDEQDTLRAARQGPFQAVMTRGKGRVTPALMDACDGLRWVARCGVGVDNIDVPGATERAIGVLNLPGSNAATIAEHTVMLMLGVARGMVEWANVVRDGHWQHRSGYDGDELSAKTVGIVGLGNIGTRVASICRALDMTVVYADPNAQSSEHERVDLPDLLARADVVTLHCALTEATTRLIDADALARMKPGAILINTARGPIIDQAALRDALAQGRLAGFGADVLDGEPPSPDDPLLHQPNVVVTPHVGSLTRATYKRMCLRSVENVLRVLAGNNPIEGTLLNADALQRTRTP